MVSGSWRVTEFVPACAMMLKGLKNCSESLLEGHVDLKNLALTKACWPTLKLGADMHWRLARPWYQSWALVFSSW